MNAQNVSEILSVLSAKFGTTTAHLWAVLIRQVYIDAITAGVVATVLSVVAWYFARWSLREWAAATRFEDGKASLLTAIAVTVGIFALIAVICALCFAVAIANPEYQALKTVLGAIGGGAK